MTREVEAMVREQLPPEIGSQPVLPRPVGVKNLQCGEKGESAIALDL